MDKVIESFYFLVEYAQPSDKSLLLESISLLCEVASMSSACQQWYFSIHLMKVLMNSIHKAMEKHEEWKAAIRVEYLCCYLSNPVFIDQATDLYDICISGWKA